MEAAELLRTTSLPARSFYAQPTVQVARALLGTALLHQTPDGLLAGRIVETEAYLAEGDLAAHSSAGPTRRNGVVFGPPGHAYVFTIYGMHCCLNVAVEPDGTAGCVLIRALEPLCGIAAMRAFRPGAPRRAGLANGPGKLTRALGIGMRHNGADLLASPLSIRRFATAASIPIQSSPRIGISKSKELVLRFFIAHNECVSRR